MCNCNLWDSLSLHLLEGISNEKPSNLTAVKRRVAEKGGGPDENGEAELVFKCKYFEKEKEKEGLQGHYSKGGNFLFLNKEQMQHIVSPRGETS